MDGPRGADHPRVIPAHRTPSCNLPKIVAFAEMLAFELCSPNYAVALLQDEQLIRINVLERFQQT
jgi:hypothetical protein